MVYPIFFFRWGAGVVCVATAWALAYALWRQEERNKAAWFFVGWFAKGILLPFALWAVLNLGLAWNLQPFMPEIQAARNIGKGGVPVLVRVLANSFFIISSSWAAITLGWQLVLAWWSTRPESRDAFKDLYRTSALLLSLPAAAIAWFGDWPLYPLAALLLLGPIAAYAPPIIHAKPCPPMYSRAIARLKFGKYSEAEWEIIRELERSEDDFQGWMMLADLYANHFHDLKEAERTVLEVCTRPEISPPQLSIALHRLADWNLKLAGDLDGARFALGLICERLPGTHLAHMAKLRSNQLPDTLEDLRRREQGRPPVPLPALGDSLDEQPLRPFWADRHEAARLANNCVERLTLDPNNVTAREKLARLFAERLNKANLAIEQLNLLLEMPDQPENRRAEWLGLIAAWLLKYSQDSAAARIALERIIREFPGTPQALAARRRIHLLVIKASTNPKS